MDTAIATIATVALGVTVIWGRVERIVKALKELADVLSAITDAMADQKIEPAELEKIRREAREALAAFRAILK
jgi:uncharacterized protein YoxC